MVTFELEAAPKPTHKTKGIDAIEWRKLFGLAQFALDELRDNINNSAYQVPGSPVSLDISAAAIDLQITYRKYLRSCLKAFDDAIASGRGINVDDEFTFPSLKCFEALSIIPPGAKEEIIKGVPLNA